MSYSYQLPTHMAASSFYDANAGKEDKKKSSTTDYETFIKLLVAQMRNQDPTAPADATQFVSQLASFSAVEQAVQTNAKLEALLVNQEMSMQALLANQTMSQAGHYVGKQLSTEDGEVSGIVKSVTIYGDGLLATLDNGKELVIGPGVRVSEPSETATKPAEKTDEDKKTVDEAKPA